MSSKSSFQLFIASHSYGSNDLASTKLYWGSAKSSGILILSSTSKNSNKVQKPNLLA